MKEKLKALWAPVLAVLLTAAFPAVFLYCRNAEEAAFGEIVPALLLFCALGVLLFVIFAVLTKGAFSVSATISVFFVLLLTNFTFVERVIKVVAPSLRYWHTILLALVIGLHIAFLIHRFLPKDLADDLVKVACLVFGGLIALNVILGVPHIVSHFQARRMLESASYSTETTSADADKPNIYLFLFDEYANFPQMEEFYDYDNKPLKDFFAKHDFAVSYTSQNESILTATVTTNLVNLDYVGDDSTPGSQLEALRTNGQLYTLLREQGYALQSAESKMWFGLSSMLDDVNVGNAVTATGKNLLDLAISQTIFYPLRKTTTSASIDNILRVAECVSNPEVLPEGGTFTLVYLDFPHHPFLVDENGAPVSAAQAINWKDKQYYLGQYKYATKLMLKMLENVVENDPGSVIFVQSDHGARAYGIPNVSFPLEVKANPLNAVYYLGQDVPDIEGQSTVNTLRLVLSRLWNMDLGVVDVPEVSE